MDVVQNVRGFIATWHQGGEAKCRSFLAGPHSDANDPRNIDLLTTAYHTLISSAFRSWFTKPLLAPQALVTFVQSLVEGLPSSSGQNAPPHSAQLGELLIDIIWVIDTHLDEFVADAKLPAPNADASGQSAKGKTGSEIPADGPTGLSQRILTLKQNAEQDKVTLGELVKRLAAVQLIDSAHCRERLDLSLLATAGLIPDRSSVEKKEIRTRTGLFYKQNKFNLLREQSEGYSKLSVELTGYLGASHSPSNGKPVEGYTAIEDRARQVWEKMISLIGYFDLDPNRALDIILDVFSVNLATHYAFFLALLSFSPWRGTYKRSSSRDDGMQTDTADQYKGKDLDTILRIAEAGSVRSLESKSSTQESRVLAQVLGFKFTHYQMAENADQSPRSLYLMTALLIREGFITVEDLYSHLSPKDDSMEELHKEYLAQVRERIEGAKVSLLAMAAPLESSSSSGKPRQEAASDEPSKVELKTVNQKAALVHALVSVGALRPAIAIMAKFPWLVDAHPDIADVLLRVLKYSLAPLYDSVFVPKESYSNFSQPRSRYGLNGATITPVCKQQLTLVAPAPPATSTTEFVFFFPDWSQFVPRCTTDSDLEDVLEPLMSFVGLHISRDPVFVTKFTRLGRTQLVSTVPLDPETKKPSGEPDADNPTRLFWFKILRAYLLPALPLIRGNAVCTVEIWNIIRQYEATLRWRLYGEWKTAMYSSHPELRIRQVQADREAKGILRRLSHNTIESLSGTVAKLAHSNPCIFFANAVNQIMAYDNLSGVVIQALRYVTNMGFDVLTFVILDALSNPNKDRVKEDGVHTSDWLQSLASFIGMLYRRYSADLSPVLKYVVHQLHNSQTTEIIVLRELIWKMAGIEPLPSLSDSQIAAMAGGPVLRIEAVASTTRGARLDPGDAVLKGPQRLGKALLETSLALPLLIQVAQQRQSCVFKVPNAPLKSLAGLYDTTHGVLLQYLELLTSPAVIPPEDYMTKIVPSLSELTELYGISLPLCMQIIRPTLNAKLLTMALALEEKDRVASEEQEKRLKARLAAKREPGSSVSRVQSPAEGASVSKEAGKASAGENDAEDTTMEVEGGAQESNPASATLESPWIPELKALFDDVKKAAKSSALDVIGPGFYLTFWQLSMYDISPPTAKYEEESISLRTLSRQEDSKYIAADRSADRTKRATANGHRARRERFNTFVNTLNKELKEQLASRVFTLKRLAREKQHWFAHTESRSVTLAAAVIEHCIQPRCLLSPMDADFCAQFIKIVHTQGTPGFPTLVVYDKLLGDHIKTVIFSCSEYEAKNYGRFLLGVLSDLWKWAQDEQLFTQDNRMKVGGKSFVLPGFQRRWSYKLVIPPEEILSWDALKQILRKWHKKITKCILSCIESGEFMHVYNAIIILKEILPVYPMAAVGDAGPAIDNVIEKLLEKEERGDLKILARAYSASLKKRDSQWILPKPTPTKPAASPVPPAPSAHADKPQISTDAGPVNGDTRENAAPSAVNGTGKQVAEPSTSPAKMAIDSIPRPEKVKRVRQDRANGSSTPDRDPRPTNNGNTMDIDSPNGQSAQSHRPAPATMDGALPPTAPQEMGSRPQRPLAISGAAGSRGSPRPRGDESMPLGGDGMPPPSAPSQTLSAQELRETAKQSIGQRPLEKPDDRRLVSEHRGQSGSGAPSPSSRRRSLSPPTRPGTRNHSQESRASGGRSRSDRGGGDGSDDRHPDRHSDRELRSEPREPRRESRGGERSGRERTVRDIDWEREGERDRDRGRDRHERERDRERDREREKDRDRRDRDREREKDRDRDRDRHRRDEKDRDRESRKERDVSARGAPSGAPTAPAESRPGPVRPDTSRHRGSAQVPDDALGKRRRGTVDDEGDRSSKRSSRKESHREDRSRRPDKEERPRDVERRRGERDASEGDIRAPTDRLGDKRPPEGPKQLPPSGPRAMASTDPSRSGKGETPQRNGDWKSQREHPSPFPNGGGASQDTPSLRSRIGDKETPRGPQAASASHRDDERDHRKRTFAEREKDVSEPGANANDSALPPKRPKLNRNRYPTNGSPGPHGVARKTLPIDPTAGDKSRSSRKD